MRYIHSEETLEVPESGTCHDFFHGNSAEIVLDRAWLD